MVICSALNMAKARYFPSAYTVSILRARSVWKRAACVGRCVGRCVRQPPRSRGAEQKRVVHRVRVGSGGAAPYSISSCRTPSAKGSRCRRGRPTDDAAVRRPSHICRGSLLARRPRCECPRPHSTEGAPERGSTRPVSGPRSGGARTS
eukprot:3167914-Prymnesium_polylepis.1